MAIGQADVLPPRACQSSAFSLKHLLVLASLQYATSRTFCVGRRRYQYNHDTRRRPLVVDFAPIDVLAILDAVENGEKEAASTSGTDH